jgi:hypothetical protein
MSSFAEIAIRQARIKEKKKGSRGAKGEDAPQLREILLQQFNCSKKNS